MNEFQEDLQSFTKKVIPNGAPDVQVQEMRRAFVSGAKIMALHAITDEDFMDYVEAVDEMFEYITEGKTL